MNKRVRNKRDAVREGKLYRQLKYSIHALVLFIHTKVFESLRKVFAEIFGVFTAVTGPIISGSYSYATCYICTSQLSVPLDIKCFI